MTISPSHSFLFLKFEPFKSEGSQSGCPQSHRVCTSLTISLSRLQWVGWPPSQSQRPPPRRRFGRRPIQPHFPVIYARSFPALRHTPDSRRRRRRAVRGRRRRGPRRTELTELTAAAAGGNGKSGKQIKAAGVSVTRDETRDELLYIQAHDDRI